jgi:mono/diheme cytochrome c family protein
MKWYQTLGIVGFASLTITIPGYAQQKPSVERGKIIFNRVACVNCHPGGINLLAPDKPIKGEKFAKEFSDEMIVNQIRKGKGNMPPHGKDQISDQDIRDVIAYIHTLTPPMGGTKPANK